MIPLKCPQRCLAYYISISRTAKLMVAVRQDAQACTVRIGCQTTEVLGRTCATHDVVVFADNDVKFTAILREALAYSLYGRIGRGCHEQDALYCRVISRHCRYRASSSRISQ